MKTGKIAIIGPIGRFKHEDKEINGLLLIDVVSQVTALEADVDHIEVEIAGPGGRKDVGDSIYNYLMSLKPRFKITMLQVGDIGSVCTKIWFAGDVRKAMKGAEMFIHNPWKTTEGDAAAHKIAGEKLQAAEDELTMFYSKNTGITAEGIKPLLSAQTSFDADKAVELKFATETYEALNIAAYMENKNDKLGERIDALFNKVEKWMKGDKGETLMLSLQLSDGNKLSVPDAETEADAVGKKIFTADQNGNATSVAPADGELVLRNGKKVTVEKGKVTKIAAAEVIPPDQAVYSAKLDALEAKIDKLISEGAGKSKTLTRDELEEEIKNLKKEIKTGHRPAFKPSANVNDDIKEWDETFKQGLHTKMKKEEPERYMRLFHAKFNRVPNMD